MRRVYEIVPLKEIDGMLECADEGIIVLSGDKYYVDEIARIYKVKYEKVNVSVFHAIEGECVFDARGDFIVVAYRDKSFTQYEV